MYNQAMDEEESDFESTFEIMIDENQMMGSSYVLQNQAIKFPVAGFSIDQTGISSCQNKSMLASKIKIDTKNIKQKEVIGQGSAGQVRRAVYPYHEKDLIFAIKNINANDQQKRKQLLNDLREYLTGKPSEYLIEFYTCYYQDGLVKQVIEFMDMGSLKNIIKFIEGGEAVSEEVLAQIAYKILMGLHHIHTVRKSIHRDIKPDNILFNSKGDVKITDFGVSKCIEHSLGKSTVGTVTYMSPERFDLGNQCHTYKCDIWSFGLIIYELATGKRNPYSASTPKQQNYFQVFQKIVNQPAPQLPQGQFSVQLCDFVKRCLVKNQNDRADVNELLAHPWIHRYNQNHGKFKELVERMIAKTGVTNK